MLPLSQINYFDIYTLDFSHLREFAEQVDVCGEDALKQSFQKACNGTALKATLAQHQRQLGRLTTASPTTLTDPEDPFYEFATQLQTAKDLTQGLLDQYAGSDPYALQDLVHKALGFYAETDRINCQHYLELMRKTGFVITTENPHSVRSLSSGYLETHPEIETLSLGCGKAAFSGPAACHFRRKEDHATASFKIALDALIGPDLITDMHNPEFWAGIQDGRFLAILDHSYGNFLFEDARSSETLQQLFRTLKPGGYLEMDFPYTEQQIAQLTQAGFVVEANLEIARKPFLNSEMISQ